MNASPRLAQLEPRQKPEASQLIQEIRDAVLSAQSLGVFDKINRAHLTRRCLWDGQSSDGMRHGENAFPWDRSIDSKCPLADEIVTEHVRTRMASIRAGTVQIGPQNQIEDSDKAGLWNRVLRYYTGQDRRALKNHTELFQTCVEEIGYGVMQVGWQDVKVLKPKEIYREQVASFRAQQIIAEMLDASGVASQDELPPEWIGQAAANAVAEVDDVLSNPLSKPQFAALLMAMDADIPEGEALKAHAEMRKSKEGEATVYVPRGTGGKPWVKARIPWVDCGHATDLGPDGKCSWWFTCEWLSEIDLRLRAQQEEADPKWLEEVLSRGGNKGVTEMVSSAIQAPVWLLNGVGLGIQYDRQQNQQVPMYQILTLFRVAVNQAGIPAIYKTLLNVNVPDLLGMHECCEVGEMPFVAEAREQAALMMQSRGVPEIVLTNQLAIKKLTDATTAMAELAAFPPYERAMGDGSRIAPGQELPVKRNTGTNGTQSRFLDVPGVDSGALKAMDGQRQQANRRFARGADVDPDMRRLFLEDLGGAAVLSWEETVRLIWLHVQAYVDGIKASRIAGQPVSIEATAEDLEGTADVRVEFSAMSLNQKTALELADYVTKLAGLDRTGRIDFGKVVELITRMFDPVLSENIIMPGDEAAAKIEKDEQDVISAITSGQYVTGRVNSPQLRWQVLQRWLANPTTTAMLQANPMMYQSLMEHIKGLQQEMVQKTTNVFTGQTGQKPDAPWEQAAKPEQMVRGMVEGVAA